MGGGCCSFPQLGDPGGGPGCQGGRRAWLVAESRPGALSALRAGGRLLRFLIPSRARSLGEQCPLSPGPGPAEGCGGAGPGVSGGRKNRDPARPLPRAGRPLAGSSPAARHPPGISLRTRFRRWQRWPSPELPAMAGAPGPLRLALLLLGMVGRAGPRPQVRSRDPDDTGGGGWLCGLQAQCPGRGPRDLNETPRPLAGASESLVGSRDWRLGAPGLERPGEGLDYRGFPPTPARRPLPRHPGPSARAPAAPRPPCADFCSASPFSPALSQLLLNRVSGPGTARHPPGLPLPHSLTQTPLPQCLPRQSTCSKTLRRPWEELRGPGCGDPAPLPFSSAPSTAFDSWLLGPCGGSLSFPVTSQMEPTPLSPTSLCSKQAEGSVPPWKQPGAPTHPLC